MEKKDTKMKLIWRAVEVVVIVAFIVALLLMKFKPELFIKEDLSMSNIKVSTEAVEAGLITENQAMTYFLGFDKLNIKLDGIVPLGNNKKNAESDIYMEYTIYDESGTEIYKSDLIEAGREFPWKAGEVLGVGEFKIVLHEQPYQLIDRSGKVEKSNLKPLYYIDQHVSITITEEGGEESEEGGEESEGES